MNAATETAALVPATETAAAASVPAKRKHGEKFVDKYSTDAFQIKTYQAYEAPPEALVIPPKTHPLYDLDGNITFDERMVQEIDNDGHLTHAVTVWSDPDRRQLIIVDGRGCVLCVHEVNRRRAERGDAPIQVRFFRLDCDLDRAIEHVTIRNFHRKRPSLGHYGREVAKLFRLGKSWSKIAELLHLDPTSAEGGEIRLKRLLHLSYCVPEVVEAIEDGRISLRSVRDFTGDNLDGSERLSEEEQLQVLADKIARAPKERNGLSAADKKRVAAALTSAEVESIKSVADREAARVAAAVLARMSGDAKALSAWPELAMLINAALVKGIKAEEVAE